MGIAQFLQETGAVPSAPHRGTPSDQARIAFHAGLRDSYVDGTGETIRRKEHEYRMLCWKYGRDRVNEIYHDRSPSKSRQYIPRGYRQKTPTATLERTEVQLRLIHQGKQVAAIWIRETRHEEPTEAAIEAARVALQREAWRRGVDYPRVTLPSPCWPFSGQP